MGKGEKHRSEITGRDALGERIDRVQVFDGRFSWDYDRVKREVTRIEVGRLSREIREQSELGRDHLQLGLLGRFSFNLQKRSLGGKEYLILLSREPFRMGNQEFSRGVIWLDPGTRLPWKVETENTMEIPNYSGPALIVQSGMIQEFQEWDFNPELSDELFQFTPPPDARVIDQTGALEGLSRMIAERREEMRGTGERTSAGEGTAPSSSPAVTDNE